MLDDLAYKGGIVTRMISAENPTGEKGKGATAKPSDLPKDAFWGKYSHGEGWKVNPFKRMAPGEKFNIADISGSGTIKNIFITTDRQRFSEMIIRIFWDGETEPSVECPLGAFFCMGHDGVPHTVNSLPVVVAPYRGLNAYWSMPFRKRARIELENRGDTFSEIVAYKVLYHAEPISDDACYFHAVYRRSVTSEEYPRHVILDNVQGRGVNVGTYLAWTVLNSGWWGEGEVKFFIDGDDKYPTICDNGTEDYFGGAWNFGAYGVIPGSSEVVYSTPYIGVPAVFVGNGESPKKLSMYRFHIEDCIGFEKDIKVTVDTIGWQTDRKKYKHLSEDVASVAFWYQSEPHVKFKPLPPREKLFDR